MPYTPSVQNTVGSSIAAGNERSKQMLMEVLKAYLGSQSGGGDGSGGLTADQVAAFGSGQGPMSASGAGDYMSQFNTDPLFNTNTTAGSGLIQTGASKLSQSLSQSPGAAKSSGSSY